MEFEQYDPDQHKDKFVQLNIEYLTWMGEQLLENYQIDAMSMVGSVEEYVESHLEPFTSLTPPNGVLYIVKNDGKVAGMGALRKLRPGIGEVKRMWICPEFRGRGFGEKLFRRLLDDGRVFGWSEIWLDTGKFMAAAQHIYRKYGFTEREVYPESEPLEVLRPHWIWMEKKL